jgi:hypothetical protein
MKNVKTVHLLAILSIIDLLACKGGGGSLVLWIGYGVYKLFQGE